MCWCCAQRSIPLSFTDLRSPSLVPASAAPTVSSIALGPSQATPTSNTVVVFDVTYSEAVQAASISAASFSTSTSTGVTLSTPTW